MTSPASPVRAIRNRLGRLRRRIRTLFALQGLARWVTAAIGVLALFFLADWLLELPLGVRRFLRLGLLDRPDGLQAAPWILLVALGVGFTIWATRQRLGAAPLFAFLTGGVVGILGWLAARLLLPVGADLPDRDLVLSVEERYRDLNDRLAAALDFERELASPVRGESTAMMERVVEDAADEARRLEFSSAVSARSTWLWLGGALAAVGAAALVTILLPGTVGLWAQRSLLLEEVEWPRSTTLVAVDLAADGAVTDHDPTQAYEVPVGRPLLIHALAQGDTPDEVLLVDRAEGARPLPRRMFAVPDRAGLFQLEIRDVRHPFDFVLLGGDDDDEEPVYRVEIVVPPRVMAIRAHLVFPEYLGRDPEDVEGGALAVPEGTRVEVSFETDVPVAEARAILADATLPAEARDGDGRSFTFAFDALETVRYRVQLRTAEGRENDPAADTYEVRVAPDRAPRVTWVHPRGPVEITPTGRVPILLLATDDHAVTALDLEIRVREDDVRRFPLRLATAPAEEGTLAATDGPFGRPEVRAYVPLDLAELADEAGRPPAAPARLSVRAVARDSKGQTRDGPWAAVDVYAPIDVERAIVTRRSGVRTLLAGALAEQKSRREELATLVGAPMEEGEKDLLRTIQFAQAKISQDVDDGMRSLVGLFNDFVHGRLGAENAVERILVIYDRHHRATYGAAPEVPEGAAEIVGDPVFPYALYDEVLRAWRDRRIFDSGLVKRMLGVLDDGIEAAARTAPAAHRAVADAVAGEATLAEALAAQDALITRLERVLEAVQSWKTLHGVILDLRRLIEEQEALHERLDPQEVPNR